MNLSGGTLIFRKDKTLMKKNKRIWIPIIIIAGVILLSVVILIGSFIGILTFGQLNADVKESQLTKYVNENYQELEAMSEELLAKYQDDDLQLFVGENGYWTMVESPDENIQSIMLGEDENGHRFIQYGFKSTGNVVSGRSYDIVYSPDDVPVSKWYSSEYKMEKTGDIEWTWDGYGDNGGLIRKIRDKFYLCEDWC